MYQHTAEVLTDESVEATKLNDGRNKTPSTCRLYHLYRTSVFHRSDGSYGVLRPQRQRQLQEVTPQGNTQEAQQADSMSLPANC